MPLPQSVRQYEAEWMGVAQTLVEKNFIEIPTGDRTLAFRLRQRFYGFRKALEKHDAANPFLGALMETMVTVKDDGTLVLQRAPFATLLRGFLEHTKLEAPAADTAPVSPPGPSMPASEQFLLDYLSKKD